ncbi:MAG: hypothetical protein C4336_01040, partial [Armatimonadota bacterium]
MAGMEEMKTRTEENWIEPTDGQATDASSSDSPVREAPPPAPPMDWKRFGVPMAVILVLMVGLLITMQVMPRAKPESREKTLSKVPAEVGEWRLFDEYEVGERALKELMPDEYLARIYMGPGGEQVDLSIIAGSHTGAFHNPQVCFRVQNWEFIDNREIELNVTGLERPIRA